MEKRKYDFKEYAQTCEERKIEKNGVEVCVMIHIPYKEKEDMAKEMAENLIMVHDDSCVYVSSEYDKVLKLMIAKYYTNIDTTDADAYDVIDFMINSGVFEDIEYWIEEDLAIVLGIYKAIVDAFVTTYKDDKGLTKAIRTSFGFMFNGEDITESIAKAEAAKDTIYRAVGALRRESGKGENALNNGEMNIGGQLINLARRD